MGISAGSQEGTLFKRDLRMSMTSASCLYQFSVKSGTLRKLLFQKRLDRPPQICVVSLNPPLIKTKTFENVDLH